MAIQSSTIIKTEFGEFSVSYHKSEEGECVSFQKGNISEGVPLIRFHSACLFGEAFHSTHCDCQEQLSQSLKKISENELGVLIYAYDEGRGIGLQKKIQAMEIQRTEGCDTVEAFEKLGFDQPDLRSFKKYIAALEDLNSSMSIKMFSGNPKKIESLKKAGFIIEDLVKTKHSNLSKEAKQEHKTKTEKMGYQY